MILQKQKKETINFRTRIENRHEVIKVLEFSHHENYLIEKRFSVRVFSYGEDVVRVKYRKACVFTVSLSERVA